VTADSLGSRLALGPLAGAMVFLLLTGGRLPRGRPRLSTRSLAGRWLRLAAGAASEEILWRAVLLTALRAWVGPLGALAISSVGFALWHRPSLGRACIVHVVTGTSFGASFLAGGLGAAVLAHAVYNLLVDWAVHAERARAPAA
jgi:hypothetical protein